MKEINNQRGFSSLEIILVVAIIGIFSTVAVPKMARILDKVCLDYELKHLYSELNLARSIGKSSTFTSSFGEASQQSVELWIYSKNYGSVNARNRYQIMRQSINAGLKFYQHNLSNDIKLEFNHGNEVLKINFNNPSRYSTNNKNVGNLELKSKYGNSAYIIFDSVGRWRGAYER